MGDYSSKWAVIARACALMGLLGIGSAFADAPIQTELPVIAETTLDSPVSIAAIQACASDNLPSRAGVIEFSVDAVDRSGEITSSRAEIRWRKPDDEATQILLVVSEPAKTAGTALLIVDRHAKKTEFFVRLPEMKKVKRVRSRRLRGPVLGTDFSYEDLKRLREPIDRTELELIGEADVEDRRAWVLETIPDENESEYSRVLTYVDRTSCLPLRIDLFEPGSGGSQQLRKRLVATPSELRPPEGESEEHLLPHRFVMEDLRRETQTVVKIERFKASDDLPAEHFTRAALQESMVTQPAAAPH